MPASIASPLHPNPLCYPRFDLFLWLAAILYACWALWFFALLLVVGFCFALFLYKCRSEDCRPVVAETTRVWVFPKLRDNRKVFLSLSRFLYVPDVGSKEDKGCLEGWKQCR